MNKNSRIFVAGHRGLVGSAIYRQLAANGYTDLLIQSHSELDLCDWQAVAQFFKKEQPEYVFLAAARVGGILANMTYPADFIRDNLLIQTHVVEAARQWRVKKLMILGSSCIYPRECPQPMKEEYLMTGPVEPTNEAYAIAKIAGLKMAQAYCKQYGMNIICPMPTNIYGPGDHFDLKNAHVLPALLRRFHEAKVQNLPIVTVWGSGTARREFMYVDDLANGLVFLMENYDIPEIINIGTGQDISIRELSELIQAVVGYTGDIDFDPSKPDGMPVKRLDVSRLTAMGWTAKMDLKEGIMETYRQYEGR